NIYVSATNHGFDPKAYLEGIPVERVRQMHLAGYSEQDTGFLIDTHDHPVTSPVWDLYRESVRRFGAVPALIEWDDKIPPFEVLEQEAKKAEEIREEVLHPSSPAASGHTSNALVEYGHPPMHIRSDGRGPIKRPF